MQKLTDQIVLSKQCLELKPWRVKDMRRWKSRYAYGSRNFITTCSNEEKSP